METKGRSRGILICWDEERLQASLRNMVAIVATIPEDIIHLEILPWLTNKALFKFKSVNKKWHHLINHDPTFAHQRSRRCGLPGFVWICDHNIDFMPVNLIGQHDVCETKLSFSLPDGCSAYIAGCSAYIAASANGLLLLLLTRWEEQNENEWYMYEDESTFHYVWNPVTKEGHAIPESQVQVYENIGLAFEPSTTSTRYRLIKLVEDNELEFTEIEFKIYSSDIGKWIISDQKLVIKDEFNRYRWNVLYARGIIYWNYFPYIIWFDLDKNISGSMMSPIEYEDIPIYYDDVYCQCIGVTDEEILTSTLFMKNNSIFIWMMSKDGEWVKRYHVLDFLNIRDIDSFSLLPFCGGDKVFMDLTLFSMGRKAMLCCHDMKTGETVMIDMLKQNRLWSPCQYVVLNYNNMAEIGSLKY
nr:PREDICTED: uncharacterized protein LOC103981594 isoform X1 [Musa acuminata subsp. malaccensis]